MFDAPILVTGATGTVGRVVVDHLLGAGVRVRAAAGSVGGLARLTEESLHAEGRLEAVVFDFTEPTTWSAFDGVESVFVLRPPHLGRPRIQMLPSLDRMRAAGVRHVVLLSLQGAGRNRFVPHAAIEAWLRDSGLEWTFVRPSFFMQNLTTTHAADIRDRDEILVPAGHGATSFVDAADVGAVAARALLEPERHRHRIWTPTGPEALTYREVAATLGDVLGRPIRYTAPGIPRYVMHAHRRLRMPLGMVAVTTAIYAAARLGSAAGLTEDVRSVLERPPVSFADFAQANAHVWDG